MSHVRHLLAATLCCGSVAAEAATLYGTEYAASTPLYTLNETTGALTVGPATGIDNIGDLASSGTDNTVWAVRIPSNTLYRFDAGTSATVSTVAISGTFSPSGAPENIVSIAYDAKGGTLYGNTAASFGGANNLYTVNTGTGASSLIGNLQINNMFALAFDEIGGFLYGASGAFGAQSFLWKINPFTAATTLIGELAPTSNFDMAFRPDDNKLFMASSTSSSLYTVDITNAATTLVGPYGSVTNIAGLAFAVPEPQTWALMLVGLGAAGWAGIRRRG